MKILNCYANIGGNRKYWGDEHEITAVELDPNIAMVYQRLWPNDVVIVGDAHQYLLEHFSEFDFIWCSPPCPTHSRMARANTLNPYKDNSVQLANGGGIPMRYPDMKLYQEIILLTEFHRGKWCVENVISYYEPLIPPVQFGSHYFWTNFYFPDMGLKNLYRGVGGPRKIPLKELADMKGYDLKDLEGLRNKELALRDITEPELGKHILDWALKEDLVLF
jgi:DNA (cytosine-5)-methyltransferase 1